LRAGIGRSGCALAEKDVTENEDEFERGGMAPANQKGKYQVKNTFQGELGFPSERMQ